MGMTGKYRFGDIGATIFSQEYSVRDISMRQHSEAKPAFDSNLST
jgi:hypothetical protein